MNCTRCAIVSQPTCSKPVPTCARFSCCWDITIWKKPPSTCIFPNVTSAPPLAPWTRSHCHWEGEPPAAANDLNEPASLGDGRPGSQRGAIILRTQPPVDDLATPESAAGHRTMPHRCARRSSRPVFPLRTFRHLLQLVSQSPLSQMPGQCPPPLAGGAPPRIATHPLRACRFHSAA